MTHCGEFLGVLWGSFGGGMETKKKRRVTENGLHDMIYFSWLLFSPCRLLCPLIYPAFALRSRIRAPSEIQVILLAFGLL